MKIAILNRSYYCLRRSKYFTSFMLSVFAARGLLHAATIWRTSAFSTTGSWWLRTSCDVTTPSVRVKTEMEPWDSAHQISAERPRWMLATEWMQEALLIIKSKLQFMLVRKLPNKRNSLNNCLLQLWCFNTTKCQQLRKNNRLGAVFEYRNIFYIGTYQLETRMQNNINVVNRYLPKKRKK